MARTPGGRDGAPAGDRPAPAGGSAPRLRRPSRALPGGRVLALPLGAAAGLIAAGAFPPIDVAPLAVVGLTGALWVARRAPGRWGPVLALLGTGLGSFGLLVTWSLRFGAVAYLALLAVQALFLVPVGAAVAWVRHRGPLTWVLATTAAWTLAEAVRNRVPLGGFEWGQPGVAAHGLPVRHAAAVVGSLGVTALLVALAAALALALDRGPRAGAAPVAGTLLATVVLAGLGAAPWTRPTEPLTVAIVQTAPVCPGVYAVDCPDEGPRLRARFAEALTQVPAGVDLVLWGEGGLGGPTPAAAGERLIAETGRLPAPLLAGVTGPGPREGTFFNRNVLFSPDGEVLGAYAKQHPVPFGEYVPARDLLGGVGDVGRLVPSDMVAGAEPGRLPLGGRSLGTVSSWEVTFSRLVRGSARGTQLLTTLTTQETYERAPVSDQLLRAAQLRAAEARRPMLVAATTGRSAHIDDRGRRVATTRLYDGDLLVTEVVPRRGATPFLRLGDAPAVLLAVGTLAVAAARGRRPQASA